MRSLTQYQEDSADFVCRCQICRASCAPQGQGASRTLGYLALISEKRADIAGLDFFSWTSSRAALFAAAEFTPSPRGVCCWRRFNPFAFYFAFSHHNSNTPELCEPLNEPFFSQFFVQIHLKTLGIICTKLVLMWNMLRYQWQVTLLMAL